MSIQLFCLFFFFSSFIHFSIGSNDPTITKIIYVKGNGNGNFNSIQAAINSIPDGNNQWIKIHIGHGTYMEKVTIPPTKGHLILEGEGPRKTIIAWGDHEFVEDTDSMIDLIQISWNTATFYSLADNVILSGIAFKNSFGNLKSPKNAVAALINGDKTSIYNCSFLGIQDTLSDLNGRHYFKDCYIEGIVDFIYGYGQSIYENCVINTISSGKRVGYVTAQGREHSNDTNGFVFKNCHLKGSGKVYLGRGWRTYSRVLFYQTRMEDIVVPEGWYAWQASVGGRLTQYAEVGCTGPGSATGKRVTWEKKLSNNDVSWLTSLSTFINKDGWLDAQPYGYSYISD